MNIERIKLNLIPTGKMPVCHTSQYDKGRDIGIDIFYGMKPYILTDETLELDVRKPDTHIVTIDVPVVSGKNGVTFRTTEQMCAVSGSNLCELKMRRNGDVIGSLNFVMEVERSPMEGGLASDSEIDNLATQMTEIAQPLLNNLVPPMVTELVPQVVGDDYYNKEQTDELLGQKANANDVYNKTETDNKLGEKANASDVYKKTETYKQTEIDNKLNGKMDKDNPTGTGSFSLNRMASSTIGFNSVAMGDDITASGMWSNASNQGTAASGFWSHAEGSFTVASGSSAHSEGGDTTASGDYSHAEGGYTMARGDYSHAEGSDTTANGNYSHAEGNNTTSNRRSQHVFGEYNIVDIAGSSGQVKGDYIEIVGNGTSSARSNARTLDWSGNETLAGNLIFNGNKSLTSEIQRLDGRIDNIPADTDTWRAIKVNGVEKLGNGTSSGDADFVGSDNIDVEFDNNGNKIGIKTKNIYTKTEVNNLVAEAIYDVLPSEVASGAIANFETDLVLPIKSLEVDVNAVQESGIPTPATPLPIGGWSEISLPHLGENVFDVITWSTLDRNPQYYSVSSNQEITVLANDTGGITTRLIDVVPNATYSYLSTFETAVKIFNSSASTISQKTSGTFTAPADGKIAIKFYANTYPTTGRFILAYGSSIPTTWSAYNNTTKVINLGGTYYGGHLTQYKEGQRRFEVTHGIKLFSEINFLRSNNQGVWESYRFFALIDKLRGKDVKCSHYEPFSPISTSVVMDNETLIAPTGNDYIYIRDDAYTTVADFKTANANTQLVYELATPYTIDLPDGEPIITLNGTNNIYADTGDCAVEYKVSVNKALSSVSSATRGGAKSGGSEVQNEKEIEEPKEEVKEIGEEPISRK